ncbi:MAG: hypothetical protein AABY22_35165 [Nanoarchaeota archaeon]
MLYNIGFVEPDGENSLETSSEFSRAKTALKRFEKEYLPTTTPINEKHQRFSIYSLDNAVITFNVDRDRKGLIRIFVPEEESLEEVKKGIEELIRGRLIEVSE